MDTKRPDENKYPTLQNIYPKIIPVKTTSPSPQPTRSPPEARSYNWSVHLKSVSDALKDYCRKASSRTPKYFRRSTNALSSVMQSNNSFSARNLQTTMPTFRKHANNHWRACQLHLTYFMLYIIKTFSLFKRPQDWVQVADLLQSVGKLLACNIRAAQLVLTFPKVRPPGIEPGTI